MGVGVFVGVKLFPAQAALIMPVVGCAMAMWSSAFIQLWSKRNVDLNMQWGVTELEDAEAERPQFQGEETIDPVHGAPNLELMPHGTEHTVRVFDSWQRSRRLLFGATVTLAFVLIVTAAFGGVYIFKDFCEKDTDPATGVAAHSFMVLGFEMTLKKAGGGLAPLINTVQIMFMNYVFDIVSRSLTEYENWRTETEFENSLITKVFCFQFVNSYGTMFFVIFFKEMVGLECIGGDCAKELETQLMSLMAVRMLWGNFTEIGIPHFKRRMVEKAEAAALKRGLRARAPSQVELQFRLAPYTNQELFDDYQEIVMLYGYAVLFVVAAPLAPALAVAR